MDIATLVGRLILAATVVIYLVYLILFAFSYNSLLHKFSEANPSWLATMRTILHITFSPGAIPAVFSIAVLFFFKKNIFLLSLLSLMWFAINMIASFIISPFFVPWIIMQAIWLGLFLVLWCKVIA